MSVDAEIEGSGGAGAPRRRHRRWSEEEKRRIVAETLEPGASVSVVARRHDVNANQVFTWRRQFGKQRVGGEAPPSFVPVVVSADALPTERPPSCDEGKEASDGATAAPPAGRMEIVLAGGGRVIVDRTVNAAALARVLGVLERGPVRRSLGEGR